MTRGGARWGGMSRRGEERREKGAENEEGGGGGTVIRKDNGNCVRVCLWIMPSFSDYKQGN